MYTKIGDTAIKLVAKVGTQSFSEAGDNWYGSNTEAEEFPTRVMFVREPLERLKSCYQFFVGLKNSGTSYNGFDFEILESWKSFVDHVLGVGIDEHWQPQSWEATKDGISPTHYLKFDDVQSWFPVFFNMRLPHVNSSKPIEVDIDYRKSELESYYADDYLLYNKAKAYEGEEWPLP